MTVGARCKTIRILIKNQLLDAEISGDETQNGKGLDNAINTWRSRFTRFKSTRNQSIKFNRDTPEIADSFFIKMNGKLITARLILYKGENQTGGISHDSGIKYVSYLIPLGTWRVGMDAYGATVNNANDAIVYYFDPTIYQSAEIIVNEKSASDYLDVHFMTLGQSFAPERGISFGGSLAQSFNQADRRTRGGSLLSTGNKSHWRESSASLDSLTTSDRIRLFNELQETGGKGAFINPYPDDKNSAFEQQNAFIGNLSTSGYGHISVDEHSTELIFREA